MSASRSRTLVPALLLLIVAAVVTALLLSSSGDGDDSVEEPTDAASVSATMRGGADQTPVPAPEAGTEVAVPPPAPDEAPDTARRIEGDPMAAGPADAPVSVVVYSDFACPYCQRWVEDTQPAILDYAEAGDVRLEWRDANILGEESLRAATAAAAAAQQGAFWEFHGALFDDMGTRSPEQLTALAADLGLDVEEFTADLTDPSVLSIVQANMQEAQTLRVQSTPSFIVAGTPVVGAQPTEVFVELIETALAAG